MVIKSILHGFGIFTLMKIINLACIERLSYEIYCVQLMRILIYSLEYAILELFLFLYKNDHTSNVSNAPGQNVIRECSQVHRDKK